MLLVIIEASLQICWPSFISPGWASPDPQWMRQGCAELILCSQWGGRYKARLSGQVISTGSTKASPRKPGDSSSTTRISVTIFPAHDDRKPHHKMPSVSRAFMVSHDCKSGEWKLPGTEWSTAQECQQRLCFFLLPAYRSQHPLHLTGGCPVVLGWCQWNWSCELSCLCLVRWREKALPQTLSVSPSLSLSGGFQS